MAQDSFHAPRLGHRTVVEKLLGILNSVILMTSSYKKDYHRIQVCKNVKVAYIMLLCTRGGCQTAMQSVLYQLGW